MGTLDGKVMLVFGASSGIGRAAAFGFAEAAQLLLWLPDEARRWPSPAAQIGTRGHRALALPTDVSHRDQVDRAVAATVERFGRIDVALNAAGLKPSTVASATCPRGTGIAR